MKIFAVSDIHSYYTKFINALRESGFEDNNPDHLLVCCGDYFDRGDESWELLQYLNSINNKILIRGNHEDLMEEMINRGYAMGHDKSNKTEKTFYDLVNHCEVPEDDIDCDMGKLLKNQILDPFYSQMVNYFETENYVFVHGYVPTLVSSAWREGVWRNARWENGFNQALMYGNPTGKTIVFGHWHTSYGNMLMNGTSEDGEDADFGICYFKENTIGIDACTAYSGKVNILVLEDNLLNDKN